MPKKADNPAAVRSRIALINALIGLMKVKNFNDISISEITAAAGLSRQTFYTNFEKKEDILTHALTKLFMMLEEETKSDDITSFIHDYYDFWQNHLILPTVLFKHSLDILYLDKNEAYFDHYTDKLIITLSNPEDIHYIKSYLNTLIYSMMKIWIKNQEDVEQIYRMTIKLLSGYPVIH